MHKNKLITCVLLFGILNLGNAFSQQDSLILKNRNYLVGEIKSMDKGVLVMKTPYSKEDFKIKFLEIEALYSDVLFLISTQSGNRVYGKVSSPELDKIKIEPINGAEQIYPIEDIIYIKPLEQKFFNRINGGIDMGFTLTRARNQRQFTVRSRIGYMTQKWSFDASFNKLSTSQDETENISRGDGALTSIYSLKNEWLVLARIDYLYNTEQLLDLRNNMKLGMGKYLNRTNKMNWTVLGGFSYNVENFSGDITNRKSQEAWVGSEINLFDVGDLSLLSNIFIYPSLSEKDRIRLDYRIDLKYDFPLDFYVKTGFTLNYDNQPAGSSRRGDYILQTTFGWSW
jgi:hypothetical protein